MSEHYYSTKPSIDHDPHSIEMPLRGKNYFFTADAGVFSKQAVDFGSKLLIETMEINPTDKVLDVGCGYGPIGIVAATLAHEGHVTMIDVNERALKLAEENLRKNGIQNATVKSSNVYSDIDDKDFDVILSNPPIRAGKEIVHRILKEAAGHLKPEGSLWIVIQKKQGAPSAWKKLEEVFSNVSKVIQDKGYWIIKATK